MTTNIKLSPLGGTTRKPIYIIFIILVDGTFKANLYYIFVLDNTVFLLCVLLFIGTTAYLFHLLSFQTADKLFQIVPTVQLIQQQRRPFVQSVMKALLSLQTTGVVMVGRMSIVQGLYFTTILR